MTILELQCLLSTDFFQEVAGCAIFVLFIRVMAHQIISDKWKNLSSLILIFWTYYLCLPIFFRLSTHCKSMVPISFIEPIIVTLIRDFQSSTLSLMHTNVKVTFALVIILSAAYWPCFPSVRTHKLGFFGYFTNPGTKIQMQGYQIQGIEETDKVLCWKIHSTFSYLVKINWFTVGKWNNVYNYLCPNFIKYSVPYFALCETFARYW